MRRRSAETHTHCRTYDPRQGDVAENAYDYVIDAVGSKITRRTAIAAIKPGGVLMHIGLQDWASEIDMRKITLSEITLMGAYTYTTADMRTTVDDLQDGAFGSLDWVEIRPLAEGQAAFRDLDHGATAAAKVVLLPWQTAGSRR